MYDRWEVDWNVPGRVGTKSELRRYLGIALRAFLNRQLSGSSNLKSRSPGQQGEVKVLLTKTPSVVGIGDFFDFFPEDYLIVLVRDGRAVVESGVRSFGWRYEAAMHAWADSAKRILQVSDEFKRSHNRFLLVRYEDVFRDERGHMEKICSFLGLDPGLYRFDSLNKVRVRGSSDGMRTEGRIDWDGVPRALDFDPLSRFSNWDREKHTLFNRIAGGIMEQFGYEPF